jgi:hypothetical protein
MICCPTSKVAKPHILGAIYRLQKKISPTPSDPRGLGLDWGKPDISWLSDERPAVVKRAINALAKEENIDALRSAKNVPALWALHRIASESAQRAVREFLNDDNAGVRTAAIHSVGLRREAAAECGG